METSQMSLIAAGVSIITLIVFFVMAVHIAKIKDLLTEIWFAESKSRRNIKPGENWICPKCKNENKTWHHKCQKCTYDMLQNRF